MKSVLSGKKLSVTQLFIVLFVIVWVGILATVGWIAKGAWRARHALPASAGQGQNSG